MSKLQQSLVVILTSNLAGMAALLICYFIARLSNYALGLQLFYIPTIITIVYMIIWDIKEIQNAIPEKC